MKKIDPKSVIPAHLQPEQAVEAVTVPVDYVSQRPFNAEAVDHLNGKLGMVRLSGEQMRSLRDLGIEVKSGGVHELANGACMVGVMGVTQAMGHLQAIVEDQTGKHTAKQKAQAIQDICKVSNAITKLTSGMMKMGQVVVETASEVDKVRRRSFQPGVAIPKEKQKTG